MGSRARHLTALAIGAACTGCALVLGYGDPVELAAHDGGAEAAASDADARETSTVVPEGAAEASVPFCPSLVPQPTFCASFDGPSYLSEWGNSSFTNATLAKDTASFVSAPASLRVAMDRKDDAGVQASVGVDFPAFDAKPFTATIAFDARVEAAAPQGALAVIANALVAAQSGPTYLLQVVCRPLADGSSVAVSVAEVSLVQNTSTEHSSSQSVVMGTWSRIQLTMVFGSAGTTGNSVKLVVDGKSAFEGPLVLPIGSGTPSLALGIATVAPETTTWALRYDNVTADLH